MTTAIACHNCKRPGHKKKDCNRLNKNSDRSNNVEDSARKWCSCHQSNDHSNENCHQQQSEPANSENKIRWSSYHKSRRHSDDQCYHQRNGNRSFPTDSKSAKDETFVADNNVTGCGSKFCCNCKRENNSHESNDESNSPPPGIGLSFAMCHPFLFLTASNSW